MPVVLHVLPHPGGGAEAYLDLLAGMEEFEQRRVALSDSRSRLRGAASLPLRRARIARAAEAIDLVHVHGDTAAALVAPRLGDRPSLITTHGLHRLRRDGRLSSIFRRRLRDAIAAASATICTSEREREELRRLVGEALAPRLVAIPNGVPLPPARESAERARARDALNLDDEAVVVLFLGRLEDRKGPLEAIEAVARVSSEGLPVVLLVAGDGPLAQDVGARASAAVRPLGHQRDPAPLFDAADAFVLPSRREGMSMALLEAMSHGLAPFVLDQPGNVEAVGDAGIVVPAGVAPLAERLAALARDRGELARLGAAARERIANELTDSNFRDRTREVYERAIAERG